MRKLFILVVLLPLITTAQDLSYYLPDSVEYNAAIPQPKDIIFHEVGEYHVTHDRLVNYMRAVAAAAPDRIKIETIGFTYEKRPQVLLTITSPKNHQRLEEIRQQHLQLTDAARSGSLDIKDMPAVVWMGFSIHGNEQSGANASLVTAYYLAAARGKAIEEMLDNTVILFDPSFNPDGMQRFSTWVNQHRSKNLVSDPNSREYNEVWPRGRYNHYWFDMNRDWLPAVHPESQNRLRVYRKWMPNVLTDHHEMGSNATFFFQPGVPARVNPITPPKNQELTQKLADFHTAYLDRIGSFYFTKESYDDFYYGKGSTYPDVNGGVGILFEQASSRGHVQETDNGLLTFPFTIRNQFVTTLSTLAGTNAHREALLNYQREFYQTAVKEASGSATKAWVFGDENDRGKTNLFIEILLRHDITVYELKNNITATGTVFKPGSSYMVPVQQPQYRLIKAIFEKTLAYKDSLFYDITSWTMPLAYGLPHAALSAGQFSTAALQNKLSVVPDWKGGVEGGKSSYAYMLEWGELYAPKALYQLQSAGLMTKLSMSSSTLMINGKRKIFPAGTIMIPVALQKINADELYALVKDAVEKNGVNITALPTGAAMEGADLGSAQYTTIAQPKVALIAGEGVNPLNAGEVWHLLDQRMDIPVTHLEPGIFNRADLSRYNTIILSGGSYAGLDKAKMKAWVQGGGILIALENAINWVNSNEVVKIDLKTKKKTADSTLRYEDRNEVTGAQRMSGAIFGADVDLSHPLAYGYTTPVVSMFKANDIFLALPETGFHAPFRYGKNPLQSGWLSKENYEALKNSASVLVKDTGRGKVICIADNPNLRAFWLGGTKLFMNSIFFGRSI